MPTPIRGLAPLWEARTAMIRVLVVDDHPAVRAGLIAVLRTEPPHVLIYSAFADAGLALPAAIAGADGVADKGLPTGELFERIRTVARGEPALVVTAETMSAGAAKLET